MGRSTREEAMRIATHIPEFPHYYCPGASVAVTIGIAAGVLQRALDRGLVVVPESPPATVTNTLHVAVCAGCSTHPDADGSEYRNTPREAVRAAVELEWETIDGRLLCPDCAADARPDDEGDDLDPVGQNEEGGTDGR